MENPGDEEDDEAVEYGNIISPSYLFFVIFVILVVYIKMFRVKPVLCI